MAGVEKGADGRVADLGWMEGQFGREGVSVTGAVGRILKRVDVGTLAGMAVETQEDWQRVVDASESLLLMVGPWLGGKEVVVLVRAGVKVEGNLQVLGSVDSWDKIDQLEGVAWASARETWILPIDILGRLGLVEADRMVMTQKEWEVGWRLVG